MLLGILKKCRWITVSIVLGLLSGCHSPLRPMHDKNVQAIQKVLRQGAQTNRGLKTRQRFKIPPQIDRVLSSGSNIPPPPLSSSNNHHFNVSVQNMPAKRFFMSLVQGTPYNIVVSPKLKGAISLKLKNVTVDDTLQAVSRLYGYDVERTNFGYEVTPAQLHSHIFIVNHLNIEREGSSSTDVESIKRDVAGGDGQGQSGQSGQGQSVSTTTKDQFWEQLEKGIKMIISASKVTSSEKTSTEVAQPSVSINPDSGVVLVRAFPAQLRQVGRYLRASENILGRQVVIEASILEVELSKGYNFGINWSLLGTVGASSLPAGGSDASAAISGLIGNNPLLTTAYGNIFKLSVDAGNFNSVIHMLSRQGHVSVMSSPRVSTLNNQKAVIKVGTNAFFVTGLTSNIINTIGSTPTTSNNISMRSFFSGIALEVVPHIDQNDTVILHIHPIITMIKSKKTVVDVDGQSTTFHTPESTIRETDSVVKAKNGQVIIIGGLMQTLTDLRRSSLAPLDQIAPLKPLNDVFGTKQDGGVKTEMVILLKPIVVSNNTWSQALQNTANSAFGGRAACVGGHCLPRALASPKSTQLPYNPYPPN